jgi:CRISPR-associated endonuclease/helicase Cas3
VAMEQILEHPEALTRGRACSSLLINIPTGLGKTAAVVLAWLWNHVVDPNVQNPWPRRLVYCLPMRTLVEQTARNVTSWLEKLNLRDSVEVYVLMGGEEMADWDLYPERPAILIGTQDMLLSRALNRGYGMSRYRWPMHFGLLNNDCLWVMDEVQLMGTGLATTTQLQGLRASNSGLGTCGPVHSIWMSATLEPSWLNTFNFDASVLAMPLQLLSVDFENQSILDRYHASKIVSKTDAASDDSKALAVEVTKRHQQGTRTLAVVNTIARARLLYTEIERRKPNAKLVLIHSRFRPLDRKNKIEQLLADPGPSGVIVVSTQVVEAGVDISAKVLFTELAPWASLVQRFGRCNRSGEFTGDDAAQIVWIDIDTSVEGSKRFAPPYAPEDLDRSREQLEKLIGKSAAPATLETLGIHLPFLHTHVIRKKDVVELFDTTPDLAGNDLDIDRYVRDTDDSDVQVFWRDLGGGPPLAQECLPTREELCTAPIGEFRRFLEKVEAKHLKLRAYRRDYLERKWEAVRKNDVFPGQAYMLDSQTGGYNPERGWTGEIAKAIEPHVTAVLGRSTNCRDDDGDEAEPLSEREFWRKLSEHTDDVCKELEVILSSFDLEHKQALRTAARWHDWGKAHQVFRTALPAGAPEPDAIWAKAKGRWQRYSRRHFRHELASALGLLQLDSSYVSDSVRDLVAYLVAAHHGKVRLSIRSLPGETAPLNGLRFARGVHDEDPLPSVDLGGGVLAPAVVLSLEPMELGTSVSGNPSWTDRTLKLRDHYNPFRLAFFEALLRAADMRASSINPSSGGAR